MQVIGEPQIKYLAIHHTAVPRSSNQLNAVDRYHRDKWGAKSSLGWYVGYNFFCDTDGTITQTRKIGEETIANVGHNCDTAERCDTISFCFAGDGNQTTFDEKQLRSFKDWAADLRELYPSIQTVGHRDLQKSRTCPGSLITNEYIQRHMLADGDPPDEVDLEKKENLLKQITMIQKIIDTLKKLLGIK